MGVVRTSLYWHAILRKRLVDGRRFLVAFSRLRLAIKLLTKIGGGLLPHLIFHFLKKCGGCCLARSDKTCVDCLEHPVESSLAETVLRLDEHQRGFVVAVDFTVRRVAGGFGDGTGSLVPTGILAVLGQTCGSKAFSKPLLGKAKRGELS